MPELQPNSRHCFACGLENLYGLQLRFYETGPNEVTAQYTVPEHFQGYPGVVHGGVVTAMLDEVTGRAHIRGDPPRFMYTAKLEVRFRKNVPIGVPLRVVGKAEGSKSRRATSIGMIYDPDGELLAEAKALLIDLPEGAVENVELEALGWKVYEEENSISPGSVGEL
jgi:acyl-coenzyme A thioesterase PaaI-like protein